MRMLNGLGTLPLMCGTLAAYGQDDWPCSALVADPSSHMAALVAVMLRSLGIRNVDATVDLPHTATELERHPYGLILVDEQLGGPAGFAMIRKMRHRGTRLVDWTFTFTLAAYNLIRMRNLAQATP